MRGVALQVLALVGDDLDDAVPDLVRHLVARRADELQHHVHVPRVVRREPLRQDGDLEDELLLDVVVRIVEVVEQLAHRLLDGGGVAHRVHEVERAAADRDVRILEREEDRRLVLLQVVERVRLLLAEARHRVEPEVADVCLTDRDEAAEQVDALRQRLGRLPEVDREVDRLEEHRVRRVVLVDVLGHLGAGDDPLQHLRDAQLEGVLLGGREVLQHLEELDLEPRGGDAVVQVVVRVVLVEHEPCQRARRLWCRRLPACSVDRQDAEDEGGDRGEDADVLLVEEGENPVRPLLRRQRVVRLSEEPQRRQRRLLPDICLGDVVR
mmetsp:Transcript_17684/g.56563  ORF Transcript_17684/g.56563 Transcript_17684/m.56563 type:complete len:324 (-) Transcript_17684:512-1483(-)